METGRARVFAAAALVGATLGPLMMTPLVLRHPGVIGMNGPADVVAGVLLVAALSGAAAVMAGGASAGADPRRLALRIGAVALGVFVLRLLGKLGGNQEIWGTTGDMALALSTTVAACAALGICLAACAGARRRVCRKGR